jgi:hypothetical protein
MAEPDATLALLGSLGGVNFTFRPGVPALHIARGDVWISRRPTASTLKVPGDLALPFDGRLDLTVAVYPVGVQGNGSAVSTAATALFSAVSIASKNRSPFSGYLWDAPLTCYYRESALRNLHGSWMCAVLSYGPKGEA